MNTPTPIRHIFYVDDDPDDIDLFTSVVDEICSDVKITTLQDSKLFLSTLQQMSIPDVIVLDVNMPACDRIECLKLLKASAAYHHIPVVLFSTSTFVSKVHEGVHLGAIHYILKGSTMEHISTFIMDLCKGRLQPIAQFATST
jgi:CheY-like chemotaxis protein